MVAEQTQMQLNHVHGGAMAVLCRVLAIGGLELIVSRPVTLLPSLYPAPLTTRCLRLLLQHISRYLPTTQRGSWSASDHTYTNHTHTAKHTYIHIHTVLTSLPPTPLQIDSATTLVCRIPHTHPPHPTLPHTRPTYGQHRKLSYRDIHQYAWAVRIHCDHLGASARGDSLCMTALTNDDIYDRPLAVCLFVNRTSVRKCRHAAFIVRNNYTSSTKTAWISQAPTY